MIFLIIFAGIIILFSYWLYRSIKEAGVMPDELDREEVESLIDEINQHNNDTNSIL